MGIKSWLLVGGLAGLAAGLVLDALVDGIPPLELRFVQVLLILVGAMVAAFVYDGSKLAAGGMEPSVSTDRPRRRWPFFLRGRRGER